MAIRFRCRHCQSLMSIATRRAGTIVPCATCGEDVLVPDHDEWSPDVVELPPEPSPPASTPEAEPADVPEEPADDAIIESVVFESVSDDVDQLEVASAGEVASTTDPDDEGFRLPRNKPVEEELDLTAMVDVVFQLLIFFMVTASFSLTKSIEVPAPDQKQKGASQSMRPLEEMQDTSIIVEIDDRDVVLVDDEPIAGLEALPDALRDRMRREQKSELTLIASASATHRSVVAVIDAANEVGMQRIRMAAPTRINTE
jgi:biopolymer transport protein ExbD